MVSSEINGNAGVSVCVYGAGAIGGYIAGILGQAGANVSLVARGAHLAAIQRTGLHVQMPNGTIKIDAAASDDPRALGKQDIVIVTVKAPALPSVATAIGSMLKPDTSVVFVMNGIPWWYFYGLPGALRDRRLPLLDPDNAMWNNVDPSRVIGGVSYAASSVIEPGVIHLDNPGSGVVLGEPDNTVSPRVGQLADLLRTGGLTVQVTDSIRHRIWEKLLNNLASGPLGILTGCTIKELYSNDVIVQKVRELRAEGAAIARASGCEIDPGIDRHIELFRRMEHKGSIVQDLEMGRPMEIDALFTLPLQLAREANVPTPNLDLFVALATMRAQSARLRMPS
ncbi:ketopantoate reductase family protein [Paraburkholderia caffeinilytica]|uniref:ketopantoate reductase family protein n=1 Tax=Paraburkholderia caffeinilytica TaxID=1761016 RepID=UPI0038BD8D82